MSVKYPNIQSEITDVFKGVAHNYYGCLDSPSFFSSTASIQVGDCSLPHQEVRCPLLRTVAGGVGPVV